MALHTRRDTPIVVYSEQSLQPTNRMKAPSERERERKGDRERVTVECNNVDVQLPPIIKVNYRDKFIQ